MTIRQDRLGLIKRRQLLLMLGASGVATLAGCRRSDAAPHLIAPRGALPKAWGAALPDPWQLSSATSVEQWEQMDRNGADLLAVSDGWLDAVSTVPLQPVAADPLIGELDGQALRLMAGCGELRRQVLPIAVSPWVILLRRDPRVTADVAEGWQLLLDPSLKGRVVLPDSPRLVISLADQLSGELSLKALRRQVLTFDDRQATNWLLKGDARVAVLPLHRCAALLKRDPRFTAVLPSEGAPLHWIMLLRPQSTREPLPQAWVQEGWSGSLRRSLLQGGWRPPISSPLKQAVPASMRSLLFPPAAVWERCWSLPPLKEGARAALLERWSRSAP